MHMRDQIGLGVTPSNSAALDGIPPMLIGRVLNKTFRQKLEYVLERRFRRCGCYDWLDLANVEVLAADNTGLPLYMPDGAVHKELDSDDVPDGKS
ncbi:CFA_G0047460.mRNA.1.CDS.1 [Saccharomyces cerevisiae]|nr:CFA_G0047460.mRNA.1.CDS.1 [Saccharomyces cerevisiae]CAI7450464.1 CFA_G0047460.mRNA.1.CDS.1 [Saccharomyces cerevisiae]